MIEKQSSFCLMSGHITLQPHPPLPGGSYLHYSQLGWTLLHSRHTQSGMPLHLQQLQQGLQPDISGSRLEFRICFPKILL